jgi:hypothetical protein
LSIKTSKLEDVAYSLAVEIHEGKWSQFENNKPAPASPEIIQELRNRCSGYTESTYKEALSKALHNAM